MRKAHRVVLIIAVALTAMTLAAGSAAAQEEPLEMQNEPEGTHCSPSLSNCDLHVNGVHLLELHQIGSEIQISLCLEEFVLSFDEDGSGYVHVYDNNAISTDCTRVMCDGNGEPAAEGEWPISGAGEYSGPHSDEGHLTMRLCFDRDSAPTESGFHCNVEFAITRQGSHAYELRANEECPLLGMQVWLEFAGLWETEATPDEDEDEVEIVHSD